MHRITVSILFICLAATMMAQVIGTWHGNINAGGHDLPLEIEVTLNADGSYSGLFCSPLQSSHKFDAEVSVEADTLVLSAASLGIYYKGVYDGKEIKGSFMQNGYSFKLDFLPGAYQAPRPQTPKEPLPYSTQDASFVNPVDSTVLHGTLTLPVWHRRLHSYPVVVMVTGSGLQDRDETIAGHKPFAVLAHNLAVNGIASLRYDDRGYGLPPSEVPDTLTTLAFASDAAAAVDFARRNVPKASSVGVLGHSEGGTIAMMLAADSIADFIVSMGGTALPGRDVLIDQNERMVALGAGPVVAGEYAKALAATLDYMQTHPQAKTWPEIDDSMKTFTHLTPDMVQNLQAIVEHRSAWMDFFIDYAPSTAISRIHVPVLAVGGDLDLQVDAEANISALRSALPSSTEVETRVFPGLNHMMQHASTGSPQEYALIEETMDPDVISYIVAWVKNTAKKAGNTSK